MAPLRKNNSKKAKGSLLESGATSEMAMNGRNGAISKDKKSPTIKLGKPAKMEEETSNKMEATNGVHVPAGKAQAKKGRGKAEKIKERVVPAKSDSNGISLEDKTKRGKSKMEPASAMHSEKEMPAAKRGRPATKKPETTTSNQNGVHEEPSKIQKEEVAAKGSETVEVGEKRMKKGKQKKRSSSKGGRPNKKIKLQHEEQANGSVKQESRQKAVEKPAKRGRKPEATASASNRGTVEQEKETSSEEHVFPRQKGLKKTAKPKRDAKSIIQTSLDLSVDESLESDDQKKSSGVLQSTTRTTSDGRRYTLKLSTLNVAGLRSWFGKEGQKFLTDDERPDILFIQETKLSSDKDLTDEMRRTPGYHSYFQHSSKKGYAGVALYSKIMPMNVTYGLNKREHDEEGRVITAEYEKFYLVGAYVPNSSRGLTRLAYRQKWNEDFLTYLKNLEAKKPVIYCGDLNVAHQEIDLANPKTNKKNAGFTDEERGDFGKLLSSGFVDAFRKLYPKQTGAYTFWTNTRNCREKNIGWRLDYFVISERLEKDLCDCMIRSDVKGSDHCPVTLFMAL